MNDLLKSFTFMGRVAKNAGISFKEAQETLQAVCDSFKKMKTADILSQLNNAEDESFFQEKFMRQTSKSNQFDIANASTTDTEENLEVNQEAIDRAILEFSQEHERRVEEEYLSTMYRMEPNYMKTVCPHCQNTDPEWVEKEDDTIVQCVHCEWEFDKFSLENMSFLELRNQCLEMEVRMAQKEMEERSQPSAQAGRMKGDAWETLMRDRARYLITKRGSLTEIEMEELNTILAQTNNTGLTGRSGSFSHLPPIQENQTTPIERTPSEEARRIPSEEPENNEVHNLETEYYPTEYYPEEENNMHVYQTLSGQYWYYEKEDFPTKNIIIPKKPKTKKPKTKKKEQIPLKRKLDI